MRQDDRPPKWPNGDKQTTSSKTHNPRKRPQYEIRQLSATLQLNRRDKMLYVPLQFRAYENFGLLDTGAIQSALSEAELRRILSAHPAALLQELPAPEFKVQIANGSIVPVRKQVLLRFFIGDKSSKKHSWFSRRWEMFSSECHSSRSTQSPSQTT